MKLDVDPIIKVRMGVRGVVQQACYPISGTGVEAGAMQNIAGSETLLHAQEFYENKCPKAICT